MARAKKPAAVKALHADSAPNPQSSAKRGVSVYTRKTTDVHSDDCINNKNLMSNSTDLVARTMRPK